MKIENNEQCLAAGQATVWVNDNGVSFSVKPLFGQTLTKTIPYSSIVKVGVGPKWWLFPGFRIMTKDDKKFYIEPGMYTGVNFKHNQLTFYPWDFKKWEKFANIIRQKIN